MAALPLRAQALESAQLQLLDGSFALAKPLGNFPDATLIHEALVNYAALRLRELGHKAEQACAVFHSSYVAIGPRIVRFVG